jgi:hypothetical protein
MKNIILTRRERDYKLLWHAPFLSKNEIIILLALIPRVCLPFLFAVKSFRFRQNDESMPWWRSFAEWNTCYSYIITVHPPSLTTSPLKYNVNINDMEEINVDVCACWKWLNEASEISSLEILCSFSGEKYSFWYANSFVWILRYFSSYFREFNLFKLLLGD